MEWRDAEILSTLTHKVRLLTLQQIARTWWGMTKAPVVNARRRLTALRAAGFLSTLRLSARPEFPLERPLATWAVGEAPPPFGKLAYALQSRWNEPPQPTLVYLATPKAAKEFGGGGGRRLRPLQASHDLHVAAIYLRLLRRAPALAALWVGEDKLAPWRRRQKLPDAVLAEDPVYPRLVIEFGNGYDEKRLRAFHADCAERGLPYELW